MTIRSVPYALVAAALLLAACSSGGDSAGGDETGAAGSAETADPSTWRLAPEGFGPLRAGQTLAEASSAVGSTIALAAGASAECSYAEWAAAPAGLRVMVVQDTVVRVEATAGDLQASSGARIGDNEGRINSLYATRISIRPHKFTTGKYLIAWGPEGADSPYRLVFETDGEAVLQFRSGRLPEVEWVEGCS